MNKIIALTHNELIKISKRASIVVITIIMVVGILALGGLMRLIGHMNDSVNFYSDNTEESLKEEIISLKQQISDIESATESTSDTDLDMMLQKLLSLKTQLDVCEMRLEKGFIDNETYNNSFMSQVIQILASHRNTYWGDNPDAEAVAENAAYIAALEKVYENNDYMSWIAYKKAEIKSSSYYSSEEERQIEIDALDMQYKADPKGENVNGALQQTISQITIYKTALLNNLTPYSQTILSSSDREDYENELAVLEYKVDKGLISDSNSVLSTISPLALTAMIGFGSFMIILLIIILAGGSVSQEISSGSIKSLIISPTRRWKIFLAKFLTLFIIGVAITLIMFLFSMLSNLIWFGTTNITPYVYAAGGTVHTLNFFVYQLAYAFVSYINVVVFMVFAFMMSIITRNTAASVGISMGVYFAGNLVNTFLSIAASLGISGAWIKFIPFTNLSLASRIFPSSDATSALSAGIVTLPTPSLTFSLCYLLVAVFCMMFTAYDSFTRRDI